MPSPFPGMDPYLEKPSLWPDVHHELLSGIRASLNELVRPKYYVRIEERVYISNAADPGRTVLAPDLYLTSRPGFKQAAIKSGGTALLEVAEPIIAVTLIEDEIREHYLEVVESSNRQVVTVIEILSPANKVSGADGLESFSAKRDRITKSSSHWVEIDLLRQGISFLPPGKIPNHEYLVHVSPVSLRPEGILWPIRLSQRLPVIPIPLQDGDDAAPLDLQAALSTGYDRAGYDAEVDYSIEPVPPLKPEWAAWAHQLLQEKGRRPA